MEGAFLLQELSGVFMPIGVLQNLVKNIVSRGRENMGEGEESISFIMSMLRVGAKRDAKEGREQPALVVIVEDIVSGT